MPGVTRKFFLAADIRRYSRADRRRQEEFQAALVAAIADAADRAGVDRTEWEVQRSGDGQLVVMPDGDNEPRVVDGLVRELDGWLRTYNENVDESARLRLRLAMHHGTYWPGSNGVAGDSPVDLIRMLDSHEAHVALEADRKANLALIISTRVYDDVVRHCGAAPAEEFVEVHVRNDAKKFEKKAWVRVPGLDRAHLVRALHGEIVVAVGGSEIRSLPHDVWLGAWIERFRDGLTAPCVAGIALNDVDAARTLASSARAREALAAEPTARLVVVVSDEVLEAAVRAGRLTQSEFERIDDHAWLAMPGFASPPRPAAPPGAGPQITARDHNVFNFGIYHANGELR